MGMPFPTGLRALSNDQVSGDPIAQIAAPQSSHNVVEWAWAMNAGSSVLGSALAMVIAIQFGLNVTLSCGAAAYLLAIMLVRTFRTNLVSV
jgi:hypothetical protein